MISFFGDNRINHILTSFKEVVYDLKKRLTLIHFIFQTTISMFHLKIKLLKLYKNSLFREHKVSRIMYMFNKVDLKDNIYKTMHAHIILYM